MSDHGLLRGGGRGRGTPYLDEPRGRRQDLDRGRQRDHGQPRVRDMHDGGPMLGERSRILRGTWRGTRPWDSRLPVAGGELRFDHLLCDSHSGAIRSWKRTWLICRETSEYHVSAMPHSRCSYGCCQALRRDFGSEDSGQTNDGPHAGQALIKSRVFTRSGNPDRGPANREEVSPVDDRRTESQVHGPRT